MALIKCSECGREISDKAAACIHCGCPMSAARPAPANAAAQPGVLYADFHAVLSGSPQDRTTQRVFVKELNRSVEFSILNNIKVGEIVKVTLAGDSNRAVMFKAVSISRTSAFKTPAQPAAPAANAASPAAAIANAAAPINAGASIDIIKKYKPNGFIQFLRSRRYYSLVFIYFGAIGYMLFEGGLYDASVAAGGLAVFFLPLIIAHILYPMHHLKKYFRKHNIEDAIRRDSGYMNVAISAYNAMPGRKILAYIQKLNPEAARKIRQQLAERKKK